MWLRFGDVEVMKRSYLRAGIGRAVCLMDCKTAYFLSLHLECPAQLPIDQAGETKEKKERPARDEAWLV
jgi:hypothetical protein